VIGANTLRVTIRIRFRTATLSFSAADSTFHFIVSVDCSVQSSLVVPIIFLRRLLQVGRMKDFINDCLRAALHWHAASRPPLPFAPTICHSTLICVSPIFYSIRIHLTSVQFRFPTSPWCNILTDCEINFIIITNIRPVPHLFCNSKIN